MMPNRILWNRRPTDDDPGSIDEIVVHNMYTFALPSGEIVTVDAADRTLVEAAGPWRAKHGRHTTYVQAPRHRPDGTWTSVPLHRLLLDPPDGMYIDHVSRDGLDNRRANLRLATRSQNQVNSPARAGGSSKFKGVCWDKVNAKWQAAGKDSNGKKLHLGRFVDEHEAARAYDVHASALWGEFAWLNANLLDEVQP